MTPNRHALIIEIFQAARSSGGDERHRVIARACAGDRELRNHVLSLLEHDAAPLPLLDLPTASGPLPAPQRIGEFRILRRIAEGGMGIVYEAQQDLPSRRVAVKVVRPGVLCASGLRRLHREALVLARLEHPGIARVYGAGTADDGHGPCPYFAMELIDGVPLTEYATRSALTTRQRLELIAQICDIVHFAHEHGVVHRDLKPANILVDRVGQPKVLDFGVARTLHAGPATIHTCPGEMVGTLGYICPEQAAGHREEPDARCDIYALGVLLYELLAGHPPIALDGKSVPEALRLISESDPPPLGRLSRSLAGDAEAVVAKAMEKDPARRYPSARHLEDDLRRLLAHQPVTARAVTVVYRFRKYLRRNRAAAVAVGAVMFALSAGLVGMTWQAVRARQETRATRAALDLLKEVVVGSDIPVWRDSDGLVSERILAARTRIADGAGLRPLDRAEVNAVLGAALQNAGKGRDAEPLLREALAVRADALGPDDPRTLDSKAWLATNLLQAGKAAEAIDLLQTVLVRRERLLGPSHKDTIAARHALIGAFLAGERYEQAIALIPAAINLARERFGEDSFMIDTLLLRGSESYSELARYEEAERCAREVEDRCRALGETARPFLARALFARAVARTRQSDIDTAEALLAEAIGICDSSSLREPWVAVLLTCRAGLYHLRHQHDAAVETARRALAAAEHTEGWPRYRAVALNTLAVCLRDSGRVTEAHVQFRRALDLRRSLYGTEHVEVARSEISLARLLRKIGSADEARRLTMHALDVRRRAWPQGHPEIIEATALLALSHADAGDQPAALALAEHAFEQRRRADLETDWRADLAPEALAEITRGHPEQSDAYERLAAEHERLRVRFGSSNPATRRAASRLALIPGEHPASR
jgi:eukaryotic-like serine/threonine-protein kinase